MALGVRPGSSRNTFFIVREGPLRLFTPPTNSRYIALCSRSIPNFDTGNSVIVLRSYLNFILLMLILSHTRVINSLSWTIQVNFLSSLIIINRTPAVENPAASLVIKIYFHPSRSIVVMGILEELLVLGGELRRERVRVRNKLKAASTGRWHWAIKTGRSRGSPCVRGKESCHTSAERCTDEW